MVCVTVLLTMAVAFTIFTIIWKFLHTSPKQSKDLKITGGRKLGLIEDGFSYFLDKGMYLNSYVFFIESKTKLSLDLLTRGAHMIRGRHPMLRMSVVDIQDKRGISSKYFKTTSDESVDVKVLKTSDWVEAHSRELATRFDSKKGPLWRLRLLEQDGDGPVNGVHTGVVIATFYHAMIDGLSIMRFIDELLDYLESASQGETSLPDSLPLLPHIEDCLGITDWPWWKKIIILLLMTIKLAMQKIFPFKNPYVQCFGTEFARNPNVEIKTSVLPMEFTREETESIISCSKKHGSTVNGTLLAASCKAIHQILEKGKITRLKKIKVAIAVNLRRFVNPPLHESTSLGLYAGTYHLKTMVPCSDELDVLWKFACDLTKQTHAGLRKGECQEFAKLLRLLKDVGFSFEELIKDVLNDKEGGHRQEDLIVVSNLGKLDYLTKDKPRTFELVRKHNACGGAKMGGLFGSYFATIHGQLMWSLAYCTNVTSREQAKEFADLVVSILKKMCKISQ